MDLLAAAVTLPIVGLIALLLLPSRVANRNVDLLRKLVPTLVGVECGMALLLTIGVGFQAGEPIVPLENLTGTSVATAIYLDGAAALMLSLVSFVGLIVSQFSIRYLDGEEKQGRYFRWLGFTIGAVSLMVIAGNLLLFFAAWVSTSFGLHQLLLHYRHRPAAHRAAWTKFAISRLGDAFLIGALGLIWNTFGTFDLPKLFSLVSESIATSQLHSVHVAIGWLLVLGGATKSAQFPFHTWLPETMETPTPVSALMHAGIVNAGGYLIIRLSPLVALAPSALMTLAIIGAFTACFAGVVMMTQTSVKRSLAYSTIAQMGFMMLQCGLGAFSAAMLHILAHSLYKAHAFLASGSVLSQASAMKGVRSPKKPAFSASLWCLLGAALFSGLAFATMSSAVELNVIAKPGGMVLAFIFCLAMTTWGGQLLSIGKPTAQLTGLAGIAGLSLIYLAGYLAVDYWVASSIPSHVITPSLSLVTTVVAAAIIAVFGLQLMISQQLNTNWLASLRIHAANGFYVDAIYRRTIPAVIRGAKS